MTSVQARLAAIRFERGADIDRLLADIAVVLARRSVRLGGVLQISRGERGNRSATVHAVDISSNARFDIWIDRGSGARGCRLNETTLIDAEAAALAAVAGSIPAGLTKEARSVPETW